MYPCEFLFFLSCTNRYSTTDQWPSSCVCDWVLVLRDIHHVSVFWVMTIGYCQLLWGISNQWRTLVKPMSSCADTLYSLASQLSPGQPVRFIIKATLQKSIISLHHSATSLLQKKHLHYLGAVGKSHRNVLASHGNVTWKCLNVCGEKVHNEGKVHSSSFQLLSEHLLRSRFDGSCFPW